VPLPETISEYLRLCCRPHKRKYVGISVMLSWSTEHLIRNVLFFRSAT
jgi:hypothetical protein